MLLQPPMCTDSLGILFLFQAVDFMHNLFIRTLWAVFKAIVLFRVGFLGCDFCSKPERWPKFSSGAIWEVSEGRGTWSTSALFSFWGNVIKRFISKWGDNSWLFPGMCCKYHFNSARSFVNVLHIRLGCGRINEVSDQSANVAAPRRRPERWSSCSPVHRSDLWPLKP